MHFCKHRIATIGMMHCLLRVRVYYTTFLCQDAFYLAILGNLIGLRRLKLALCNLLQCAIHATIKNIPVPFKVYTRHGFGKKLRESITNELAGVKTGPVERRPDF
jgi:hypothetical protein